MSRALAAFAFAALLCAGTAAADGAPPASGEPASLCAAAPAALAVQIFPTPVPRAACSASAACSDGSTVSCNSTWPEECDTYYSCSPPYVQCAARCINSIRYCPGFNSSNCFC